MKISVLIASNNNFRNSGMFSVDYAAYAFFSEYFPECKLTLYGIDKSDEKFFPYNTIMPYGIYEKIDHKNINDIYESDLIVYWSDFFHTRHFLEQYMEDYVFKLSKNRKSDEDLFYRAFFLEGADDSIFAKTISFGTSLMFLDEKDFVDDRYSSNFKNLYSKINYSMPRDTVSLSNLRSIIGDEKCSLGLDPAFLIDMPHCEKENKVGVFIGRRTEIKISDVIDVIKFSSIIGCKIEWIDWMINRESFFIRGVKNPSQIKNLILHSLLSFLFRRKKPDFENDFMTLGRFSFIVTDTYHLSINAINSGTSVFCIGDDKIIYNKNALDLHDKKKQVLFSMLGLHKNYGKISVRRLLNAFFGNNKHSEYSIAAQRIKSSLVKHCHKILLKETGK